MASEEAVRLKARWTHTPADWFETLTFGELEVGQQFICLPRPGDNSGHVGFRIVRHIFTKTHPRLTGVARDLSCGIPAGEAVDRQGSLGIFPDSIPVIPVE